MANTAKSQPRSAPRPPSSGPTDVADELTPGNDADPAARIDRSDDRERPGPAAATAGVDACFELQVARIARRHRDRQGRRQLWLSHHWPEHYGQRCVRIGSRHLCRRCTALYPFAFLVAFLSASGRPPWPPDLDPAAIWLLSIPATVAFIGEAIGLFRYSPKWQVGTTLLAAAAFGRALGYELVERWSSEFWQPIAVFGGLWFFASLFAATTRRKVPRRPVTDQ